MFEQHLHRGSHLVAVIFECDHLIQERVESLVSVLLPADGDVGSLVDSNK